MVNNSSVRYHRKKRKACESIKVFLKKKNKMNSNMIVKDIKIFLNTKINWLSIEQVILKCGKPLYNNFQAM